MSFAHPGRDMTNTTIDRRLIRQSSTGVRRALIGGTQLASALLVAVLGVARLSGVAQDAPSSAEQNWPQWRGPLQNGVAPRADPPTEWSETKNIKWKVKIPGEGAATPVIWENKVFVLTAIPTGKKAEPKPDDASSNEQNAPPPGAPQSGTDEPGRFGGG